ncbi:MAG: alpha-N-arabinofuranosidase [Bacteroidetes bacterium RBG_19FT_COMBO_42_7]|nr:MAG: alpha-N-arabinofuranosidase [Bacteroidetes bacterium RBG_19FT_COMBO_42_7]
MKYLKSLLLAGIVLMSTFSYSQNPVIRDQFSADPTARVFNGKVYLFPSHDIPAPASFPRKDWFCMEDYHVFSSSNLTEWIDHGVIVSQEKVDWVNPTSFSMWAPDCVERNGKYYFYFPANIKTGRGFGIGVAIADKPEGSYVPHKEPITNVRGIDPCVFIDKDGQAYIYYSLNRIFAARLKDNMTELASEPVVLGDLPTKGLVEGPFFFERNGKYYLTYPHVENKIERLEYAMGDNPLGPFKVTGVIMDETPMGTWTNHHSLVQYKNQWYLFYHQSAYSPKFDKNRSVCIDSLFFNEDGTIRKVVPTNRGVGITNALGKIEIDRYSHISPDGVSIAFIDTTNTFKGWKAILGKQRSWIIYNTVDFGTRKLKSVQVNASSQTGGVIQIRLDKPDGLLIAEVNVPKNASLNIMNTRLSKYKKGIHNLVLVLKDYGIVDVDWVQFTN